MYERGEDATADLQAIDHGAAIGLGRQIVRIHRGRIGGICRFQSDLAAAFGAKLIDGEPEARPWMQSILQPVGTERGDGNLHIRRGKPFARAHEQRRRAGRHGEWAGAEQMVLQPDLQLLHAALHHVVDGDRQAALQLDRRRVVILQALADARQMVHHRHAELCELILRADAGQQQKLR